MGLFSSNKNYFLGVDIGTYSIKMVELRRNGNRLVLSGYGISENIEVMANNDERNIKYVANLINKVHKNSGLHSTGAITALPAYSVFSSIVSLSGVNKKNINELVEQEAKKIIPLPLEEMVLDWKILHQKDGSQLDRGDAQVFITGSPKKLVKKYIDIFKESSLELVSLETETFSLIRSLIGSDKSTIVIVEMGANSSDISIIKEGMPTVNRSLELGGASITEKLQKSLNVSLQVAEQLKCDLGLESRDKGDSGAMEIVKETVDPLINEIQYLIDTYEGSNEDKVEKIILSGGSTILPNFADYLAKELDRKVFIGDPWAHVDFSPELRDPLIEIGPKLAVAVGLAMRGNDSRK